MTETDRLSFVVRAIDRDTSVVPVGGFKMLPINELRRNDLFEGLSSEDLDKKEKYVHFRPVENQEKKIKLLWERQYLIMNFWIILQMTQLKILGVFMLILLKLLVL